MRSYLEPTSPIAPHAVLIDDPKLAMDLATELCESPRMSNLSHGLWGYGGMTKDGLHLTIQSLGIGGPSAAAVVSELAGLGVRMAIRIGSCIALDPALDPGAVLIGTAIEPRDGVGFELSGGAVVAPDAGLTATLARTADGTLATITSVDLATQAPAPGGSASAWDHSSAAAVAAGAEVGIEMGCALVVARDASGGQLTREGLDSALLALGGRAAAALSQQVQAAGA